MDLTLALAGLGVGIIVGLTGMGGGALMTPVLVLVFGVPPVAAVSSDLAASAVMKPFGGVVHARRGTVNWRLVGWLCVGSVPSAFLGVLLLRLLGDDADVQHAIKVALGVALLLAAGGLLLKSWAARKRRGDGPPAPITVRPLPTVLLGAAGGVIVGLTSVGSGSLIIVALLALYPKLRANDLVGTDLVQAIPLVTAAALGHALFGDLHLDIAAAVLVGSIPGVLLGARISSRAPAGLVRTALVIVLLASALKLLDVPTMVVGAVSAGAVLAAIGIGLAGRMRRPAIADPAESDPAESDPAESHRAESHRAESEPAGTDQAEPAGRQPATLT
ncbi:sulfite exporter TauE/SafE family protein [Jidongwangia harbinensis]|uniref:sulfite exporter TauE/SafE family protein n=1 Tax=Jidongwangia harbinensis TaxID=2878561 RepID=UPI001CDA1807|nr:sulfite exporter TauE/SafE family protein [Jidongwangia harbinensis]MCA2217571.1 sulfite exporter TauE/SafE family protein [Jidongwangia harbinensis]